MSLCVPSRGRWEEEVETLREGTMGTLENMGPSPKTRTVQLDLNVVSIVSTTPVLGFHDSLSSRDGEGKDPGVEVSSSVSVRRVLPQLTVGVGTPSPDPTW